jgi:quaternary ammonium compound-resistance protein SugE
LVIEEEETMAWLYLFIAGMFEVGWPLGFKLSQVTPYRIIFLPLGVISMALSFSFFWLAQRSVPIGTAYAIWTGIGAAGTFLVGLLFFGDPARLLRFLSFALIVTGIIGLRVSK